jgi:hypothetical protein
MEANLVLAALKARPAAHDEEIVRSNDCYHVNPLGLELVVLLEERGEMVGVASRLETE